MNVSKRKETAAEPVADAAMAEAMGTAETASGGDMAHLKAEIDRLEAELAASQAEALVAQAEAQANQAEAQANMERWARAQADFDNFRRRARAEKEELARYAAENLIREILPVLDNLERALTTDAQAEAWRQGVELTARQLLTVLQGQGLAAIDVLHLPFDPNLHEAVLQVEAEDQAEGTVLSEVRRGYRLGDKVLRPALVAVSKRP
ncbi:MAG: nucleotide exchange factor GrpE [Symbiobacteriia bacterium]